MIPYLATGPATTTTSALGFVLIPSGKHAAFRDWDAPSLARRGCVQCYARSAKHRADVTQ